MLNARSAFEGDFSDSISWTEKSTGVVLGLRWVGCHAREEK